MKRLICFLIGHNPDLYVRRVQRLSCWDAVLAFRCYRCGKRWDA